MSNEDQRKQQINGDTFHVTWLSIRLDAVHDRAVTGHVTGDMLVYFRRLGVMEALAVAGIRITGQIGIAGFDDLAKTRNPRNRIANRPRFRQTLSGRRMATNGNPSIKLRPM